MAIGFGIGLVCGGLSLYFKRSPVVGHVSNVLPNHGSEISERGSSKDFPFLLQVVVLMRSPMRVGEVTIECRLVLEPNLSSRGESPTAFQKEPRPPSTYAAFHALWVVGGHSVQ